LRIVEGVQGRVSMRATIAPRFDYCEVRPWIRRHALGIYTAIGGNDALVISGDFSFAERSGDLVATEEVRAGERLRLSIRYASPEDIDPDPGEPIPTEELDRRLDQTIRLWRRWSSKGRLDSVDGPAATRSAI